MHPVSLSSSSHSSSSSSNSSSEKIKTHKKNTPKTNPDQTAEEVLKVLLKQQTYLQATKKLGLKDRALDRDIIRAKEICGRDDTYLSSFKSKSPILTKIVNKYREIVSKNPSLKLNQFTTPSKNKPKTDSDKTAKEVVKVLLGQQTNLQATMNLGISSNSVNLYLEQAQIYLEGNTDLSSFNRSRPLLKKIVKEYNEIISKDPSLKPTKSITSSSSSKKNKKWENVPTTNPDKTAEEVSKVLLNQQNLMEAGEHLGVHDRSLEIYVRRAIIYLKGDTDLSSFQGNVSILEKIVNKYKETVSKNPSKTTELISSSSSSEKVEKSKNVPTNNPDKTAEEIAKILLGQQTKKEAKKALGIEIESIAKYVTYVTRIRDGNTDLSSFRGGFKILKKIIDKYNETASKDPSLKPIDISKLDLSKLDFNQKRTRKRKLRDSSEDGRVSNDSEDKNDFSSLKKIIDKHNETASKDPSLKPFDINKLNFAPKKTRKRKVRDSNEEGEVSSASSLSTSKDQEKASLPLSLSKDTEPPKSLFPEDKPMPFSFESNSSETQSISSKEALSTTVSSDKDSSINYSIELTDPFDLYLNDTRDDSSLSRKEQVQSVSALRASKDIDEELLLLCKDAIDAPINSLPEEDEFGFPILPN